MTNIFLNSLKIISLNVRGIRNHTKRKAIFLLCRRKSAQICLLQETHSSENDVKLWKSQWGDQCIFSHGTQQSAGVAILFNKFSPDVIETVISDTGRWLILVFKMDNAKFIICNIYGHNTVSLARAMFIDICTKIKELQNEHENVNLIMGGDFNDAPDDDIDRFPSRLNQYARFKCTAFLPDQLTVVDAWRYLNPQSLEYTWSNANRSLQSRIDLWFISPRCLEYVKEVNHSYAPLTDHKLITIQFLEKKTIQ